MNEIILLRPTRQYANFEARLKAMYKSGYDPSEVFLAVRQKGYASGLIQRYWISI